MPSWIGRPSPPASPSPRAPSKFLEMKKYMRGLYPRPSSLTLSLRSLNFPHRLHADLCRSISSTSELTPPSLCTGGLPPLHPHGCRCAPVGCCRRIPMAAVAASPRAPTAGRPSLVVQHSRRHFLPLELLRRSDLFSRTASRINGWPCIWLHAARLRGAEALLPPTCSPGRPPAAMVGLAAGITRRDSEERRHLLMLVSRGPGRRRGNVQWVHFRPPRQRFCLLHLGAGQVYGPSYVFANFHRSPTTLICQKRYYAAGNIWSS
jgi:hypothetical protein